MNWAALITAILEGVTEIRGHHEIQNPNGVPLTDAQVAELLIRKLQAGQGNIAAFFIENGLPLPE